MLRKNQKPSCIIVHEVGSMNKMHEHIKSFRKSKGLTQEQVAQQLYVTRQLISKWEQGKSLPDIESLEKLAVIFEVSLSDLLDDESVKSITLKEAIKNKSKTKFIWLSVALSILAMIVTTGLLFRGEIISQIEKFYEEDYFYVTEFDPINRVYTFENDTHTIDQTDVRSLGTFYNNKGEMITFSDIKLNDNIKVLYSKNKRIIHSIQVIDSKVENSLYGVFVAGSNINFETISDVVSSDNVKFIYKDHSSMTATPIPKISFINEGYYNESIYEIDVTIDPLKVTQGLRIGLMTSDGIAYVDDIDLNIQKTYTYQGEYELEGSLVNEFRSIHVTYKVHIKFDYSFSNLTLYEYDKDHIFIKETLLTDYLSLGSFQAHEDTLYGIFKIETHYPNSNIITTTEEYFIGDIVEICMSDSYGFSWRTNYRFE
jgi:transcriptional regulator with XRE-family HTH domain